MKKINFKITEITAFILFCRQLMVEVQLQEDNTDGENDPVVDFCEKHFLI